MAAEADRLHTAFALFRAGVEMKREQLARANPTWTSAQVDEAVGAWLRERPGAEHGDAEGVKGRWPR